MKKRLVLPLMALSLLLCLFQSPANADSRVDSRIVPEGATEIDLRTVLGDDVLDVERAWMLSADVCVILRNPWQSSNTDREIIVWDMRSGSILSRTRVPHADYLRRQSFDDGVFSLWFTSWWEREDEGMPSHYLGPDECVTASVSPDGTVDIRYFTQSWRTVMPGGKTVVWTGDDGSLYAVDLATGAEDLLIQGFAATAAGSGGSGGMASKYVPFWDELPEAPEGREFEFYPFEPDGSIDSIREFYVYEPLDEHRFIYTVSGWEWGAGFGVYDLRTRTDHRITGRGAFFGMAGDTLLGEVLQADANTYESSPLPETVQDAFGQVVYSWWNDDRSSFDISPDGTLLAHLWREDPHDSDDPGTVTILDIRTGESIRTYTIHNPLAIEDTVAFYQDTRVMLFCAPKPLGSAYLYLFAFGE